jgi:hypothetical protein
MDQYPMIGKHVTALEEPDVIFMRLQGPVSAEEGSEINRLHREFGDTHDHVFFLIDLKDLESIHPDTRKEAGEVLKDLPLRGAAVYQAGFKARVLAKLIFTAMNLFRNEKAPIEFFETASEAREWIEGLRRDLGYSVEADENAA